MQSNSIETYYSQYLKYLKNLAAMPSVFTNPEDVKKAIQYCKKVFEENLHEYSVYFDKEHNLLAVPDDINKEKDCIYLSAHIDTVDANPDEWDKPYHPWHVYENEDELVARGISDCKAGVAYQLFLSFLASKNILSLRNLVFTITFKEEGAGKKSATEIAKEMGRTLPISSKSTYLIVLENNGSVATIPTLSIYAAERGNFVVTITDHIPTLQKLLTQLPHWNPVSIAPQEESHILDWDMKTQEGGHVCSVTREKNLLTKILLEAGKTTVIKAGEEKNFSVVPTKILVSQSKVPYKHALVISNRSFDTREQVEQQLEGIAYQPLKDFSISQGFNAEKKIKHDKIFSILEMCKDESSLHIEYSINMGCSDATEIYTSLDMKTQAKVFPIVMGPGSRSQRNKTPQRLTHGKNETFDKESGKRALLYISKVLSRLECIR